MKDRPAPFRGLSSVALRAMLRPVVRFFVRQSRSYQEFSGIAKELFVEFAEKDISAASERVSVSRVSALTGLHRDEVARLRRERDTEEEFINVPAQVLGKWEQDKRYLDSAGKPRALTWEGKTSGFWRLVRSVNTHVNPASLLRELERNQIVKCEGDKVRVISPVAAATPNVTKGLQILGRDIDRLITAVTENLHAGHSVNHHINTHFDNIYVSDLPKIRRWLLEMGKDMHAKARAFLGEHDSDLNLHPERGEAGAKVVLGTFSLVIEPGHAEDLL